MDYYIANGSMDYMSKEPFDPTFNSTGFDLEDMTDSRSFEFFKSFAQHRERSIFFPIERFFSFYALFLLVIGNNIEKKIIPYTGAALQGLLGANVTPTNSQENQILIHYINKVSYHKKKKQFLSLKPETV